MQMTPIIIFGLTLFACALTLEPDKHKPAWPQRLNAWQILIGIVAIIMAILIVMNPEFYALGILGDSAFFDLLVLAISCQLQVLGFRVWDYIASGFSKTMRFTRWRIYVSCTMVFLFFAEIGWSLQNAMHRISS